jgi:hypothetical protein
MISFVTSVCMHSTTSLMEQAPSTETCTLVWTTSYNLVQVEVESASVQQGCHGCALKYIFDFFPEVDYYINALLSFKPIKP